MAYSNLFSGTSQAGFRSPSEINDGSQTITSFEDVRHDKIPDAVVQQQIRRLKSLFSEFYSGSQINVYINDVKLEAVAIGWNASQIKTPVYGYLSQKYDAILKGTFIIQGELSIAFKESAYTHLLDAHIRNRVYKPNAVENDLRKVGGVPKDRLVSLLRSGFAGATPVIGSVKREDGTSQVVISDNTLDDILGGPFEFDKLANLLEESIWGLVRNRRGLKRIDEMDSETFVDRNGISYDQIGPGNVLLITYGNTDNAGAHQTYKTITDVHFIDSSQNVDAATGFVIESYRFFAKGMDEASGPLATFPITGANLTSGESTLQPIVRNYRISLTSGIDPVSPTFPAGSLDDLSNMISSISKEIEVASEKSVLGGDLGQHSKVTKFSEIKVTISLPGDWTVSDVAYSSIQIFSPVARAAILQSLVSVIVERYIVPNVDKPVTFQTVTITGLVNEIMIEVLVI